MSHVLRDLKDCPTVSRRRFGTSLSNKVNLDVTIIFFKEYNSTLDG